MALFGFDPTNNLLPRDGIANYYGPVIAAPEARRHFDELLRNTAWKNDEVILFGKHIITNRKSAWYGDGNYSYTYSKITRTALPWTPELLPLKELVESLSGNTYNSCLLNLYHDGNDGMGWHSDNEPELESNAAIASLSFGAERKFSLKHRVSGEGLSLTLENGSLLVMKGTIQAHWLHSLPKTRKVAQPRINLTFRTMRRL